MTQPGSPAHLAGNDPAEGYGRQIRELWQAIADLRTARGGISLLASDGTEIVRVGLMPDAPLYNHPDGTRQSGVIFRRDTGESAFEIYEGNATDSNGYQQAVAIRDRLGNVILSDDTNSGFGVGRPHLCLGHLADTNTSRWLGTAATSWTTIGALWPEMQQPRILFAFSIYAPAGVTGNFRMTVNGTQVGSTGTVAGGGSGNFATWSDSPAIPAGIAFGDRVTVNLDAEVTAGSGTILAQQLQLTGGQS